MHTSCYKYWFKSTDTMLLRSPLGQKVYKTIYAKVTRQTYHVTLCTEVVKAICGHVSRKCQPFIYTARLNGAVLELSTCPFYHLITGLPSSHCHPLLFLLRVSLPRASPPFGSEYIGVKVHIPVIQGIYLAIVKHILLQVS